VPGSDCAASAGGQPIGGDGVAVGKSRLIHGGIHGVVHGSYQRGASAEKTFRAARADLLTVPAVAWYAVASALLGPVS